jgi:hypothetical protein
MFRKITSTFLHFFSMGGARRMRITMLTTRFKMNHFETLWNTGRVGGKELRKLTACATDARSCSLLLAFFDRWFVFVIHLKRVG